MPPAGILSGTRLLTNSVPDDRLQQITSANKVSDSALQFNVSRTANTMLAAPNGSAGAATFRLLVGADVPLASGGTQGTVIVGSNITNTAGTISLTGVNVTTALGYTPLNKAGDTMTAGDLTLFRDPTSNLHATTKQYVDALVNGLDIKNSCRAVATANITLSGTQTIDGVACIAGDRVLATAQTTTSANGFYVVAAGAWSRSTDADGNTEVTPGAHTFIEEGTTYAGSGWTLTTAAPITLGTTGLTFTQFSRAGVYTFTNGVQATGNSVAVLPDPTGGATIAVGASGVKVASASLAVAHLLASAYATAATVSTLMYRDAAGRAQVVGPSVGNDIANKTYVDGAFGGNGQLIEGEVPTGTINGTNPTFTLANTPIAGSVKLSLGGLRLTITTHYTLSGGTITMVSGFEPQTGESFLADYRK